MLVKRKAERDKSKYLSYDELKEYVRINNIFTKEHYDKEGDKSVVSEPTEGKKSSKKKPKDD